MFGGCAGRIIFLHVAVFNLFGDAELGFLDNFERRCVVTLMAVFGIHVLG